MTIRTPPAGSYRIDPSASRIGFVATHGLGRLSTKVVGSFPVSAGEITVADDLASSTVRAEIDAAGVDTGNRLRDTELRSPLFLKTKAFPTFEFASDAIAAAGATWEVSGQLTIKGTAVPAAFTITELALTATGFTATATAIVDRYAHGVTGARGIAGRHLELTITVGAVSS